MTTPPVTPQQQDALSLVLQAAGHGLQGDMALYEGTIYQGQPTSLQDRNLVTQSQDQTWRRSWILFLDGPNAGQERFVQVADGGAGVLRWQPPVDFPLDQGTRYVLFRDYRYTRWLAWLNETAKNIHYPLDVYVPYEEGRVRYTMPEPVLRAGWLSEVLIGPGTVAYTSPEARSVRWFHVNPSNVEGDLYLVLSRPLNANQQLLFRCRPPFAYEHQDAYTGMHSVLWPGGRDPATTSAIVPPVRLFVLGTVWRSLQQKVTNLSGQPRQLWAQNLERCARQYAQACEEWGPKEHGWEIGYLDDWYPSGSLSWNVP